MDLILDLEVNGVMCDLVKPLWLKKNINKLIEKYTGRLFFRKSGTEPVIRIYVESYNLSKFVDELNLIILIKIDFF